MNQLQSPEHHLLKLPRHVKTTPPSFRQVLQQFDFALIIALKEHYADYAELGITTRTHTSIWCPFEFECVSWLTQPSSAVPVWTVGGAEGTVTGRHKSISIEFGTNHGQNQNLKIAKWCKVCLFIDWPKSSNIRVLDDLVISSLEMHPTFGHGCKSYRAAMAFSGARGSVGPR